MTEAFRDVHEYLTDKGFQPKLNVMDNQCSKVVEKYIKATKATIHLVNPDDHRVNASEQTIQTWKEHWLAGMGTLDQTCPIQLWPYVILEGQFKFNKTPLAPVDIKALFLLDPSRQNTWQSRTIDTWHVGPEKQHYHNYRFFIPETKGC
eukprot:CCRYP_007429-RA/>CCRYP_007429-RA protein AED:0.44 eAED:0.44 QI:0/0/0/1/0/0/2/0/148